MTIYDISEKAGVSIATVSRVLNGSNNVSEKTKKKVLDVINQYEYTPNAFARGLGLNTMKTIGIMCADSGIRNVFVVFFLLVDEVGTYQYNAIYFFRDQKVHGACLGIQVVTGTTQDAVIAVGTKLLLDIIDRLGKIRIRTVGTHDTDGLHSVEP